MIVLLIGLTGFSGAGKSTVAAVFKEQGFEVLDCDRLVHQEVYRDPVVLQALSRAFGAEVLENGLLNRAALRACTFGDAAATVRLNETVLPFIIAHIRKKIAAAKQHILLDAPLLFESGLDRDCDRVVSVITDRASALQRIIQRDNITLQEAENRLSRQHPASFYIDRSDYVLYNNNDISDLREQTLKLITQLL